MKKYLQFLIIFLLVGLFLASLLYAQGNLL